MAFMEGPAQVSLAEPTGTVTFLFSDIEGSARRWELDRSAMSGALVKHDALMRAAIEAHNGRIFKTLGDAFCAAFATAPEAAAAAIDAQRALERVQTEFAAIGGLRVRMALHAGTAELRDRDYFGPSLNRVARLLAIGHGGQILVSASVFQLLETEMPDEWRLVDLGMHRLKDLAHPEHVYQLNAPDLRGAFPALRSLDRLSNNLPSRLTSFVGRDEDVAAIEALLRHHRLVTLSGAGGVGKSRCAIHIGADLVDSTNDGVWLVELARVSDAPFVPGAIAQVLNVRELPEIPVIDALTEHLKSKQLLLILDNCEHIIDGVRRVAETLLRTCPDLRIICTSREALNVGGEALYRMPSLALPPLERSASARDICGYGAVALFVDRARSVLSGFELTDENARYVAEICRRLDGIPLAIELAAARVNILTPRHLAQRLDQRFPLLTRGNRSALPRQQTMWALIDWSYELLSNDEQAFFRRLAVFAGGFTLDAATGVSVSAEDDIAAMDLLSSLVDKSLVQFDVAGGSARYRLLESTQQYALERLAETHAADEVRRAHARFYLQVAESLERANETMSDRDWQVQVEPEFENWRAALQWSLTQGNDTLLGQRLAGAVRWGRASYSATEALRWVLAAQERVSATTPPETAAKLDRAESHIHAVLMHPKASLAAAQRALDRYDVIPNDPFGLADAQFCAGRALFFLDRLSESEEWLQRALAGARIVDAQRRSAFVNQFLGHARKGAGDLDAARAYFSQALAISKSIGADGLALQMVSNLAELEFRAGNVAAALELSSEAIAKLRASGEQRNLLWTLCNAAAYLIAAGRYGEARDDIREAFSLGRELAADIVFVACLQHIAAIAALRTQDTIDERNNDRRRAARILGFVDVRLAALEVPREYTEQREHDEIAGALRTTFDETTLSRMLAEGAAASEAETLAEAMLV